MARVAIVGGCRTPFVKAGGVFAKQSALDLGIHVIRSLVAKLDLNPRAIEELVMGSVLLDPRLSNFAREIVLRTELPNSIVAHSVSNNCISGLVSLAMISEAIVGGRIRVGIAGGTESMSCPTLTFSRKAERFFLSFFRARSLPQKLAVLTQFRPSFVVPQAPSPKEPSTGLTMGQHCEITAKEWKIPRALQDQIALDSHHRAARALDAGVLAQEIAPLDGVSSDNLIRRDTTIEKLSALPPVFDRSPAGTISAGNSSALTDGASAVCLMADIEARKQGREILGYVEAIEFAAISPQDGLLMAPGIALPRLLSRTGLTLSEIDLYEVHEAFGAQVAANLHVWEHGWSKYPELKPLGAMNRERMNVNGGSIAIGHPFAATGGRLVLSLVNELKRRDAQRGIISVCAAGAAACALLISRR